MTFPPNQSRLTNLNVEMRQLGELTEQQVEEEMILGKP